MNILLNEEQFNKLYEELSKEEIDQKASEANINPSDAQKEAGNYKMGHVRVRGFDITIENPIGSKRYYGKDKKKYNVMQSLASRKRCISLMMKPILRCCWQKNIEGRDSYA